MQVRQERYNQYRLLKKLNCYFQLAGMKTISEDGHCHGLSILWMRRMTQGREQEFYQTIKDIIDCPDHQLLAMGVRIEKFFKSIDKKQNPQKYNGTLSQKNISSLIKANNEVNLDKTYLRKHLGKLFEVHNDTDNMFCISNRKSYIVNGKKGRHTVAVYIRHDIFYIYDANYSSGKAATFSKPIDLVNEIRRCLFTRFKLQVPPYIPLEITKLSSHDLIVKPPKPTPLLPTNGMYQTVRDTLAFFYSHMPSPFSWFGMSSHTNQNRKRHADSTIGDDAVVYVSKRMRVESA